MNHEVYQRKHWLGVSQLNYLGILPISNLLKKPQFSNCPPQGQQVLSIPAKHKIWSMAVARQKLEKSVEPKARVVVSQPNNNNNTTRKKPKPFSLFSQLNSIQHEMNDDDDNDRLTNRQTEQHTNQPTYYVLHVCLPSSAACLCFGFRFNTFQ